MALLIAIILWLLLILLALVCLALITPVFVRVHLTTLPQFAYQVEMRALAGLAPRLTVAQGPVAKPKAKPGPKTARPKRHRIPSRRRGHGGAVRALPTLIRDILRRIHLTKLHIDADYGLGDPAETGRLCGLFDSCAICWPDTCKHFAGFAPGFHQTDLEWQPDRSRSFHCGRASNPGRAVCMARVWTAPMTVALDQMIKIGPLRIAVLSDRVVKAIHSDGVVFFRGQKHPVAVLIKQGAALNAFELEGNPMTREHVEDLCPGAWRTVLDTR